MKEKKIKLHQHYFFFFLSFSPSFFVFFFTTPIFYHSHSENKKIHYNNKNWSGFFLKNSK